MQYLIHSVQYIQIKCYFKKNPKIKFSAIFLKYETNLDKNSQPVSMLAYCYLKK